LSPEATLPPPRRAARLFLGAVVLFLGGSGLVYEYCLSTVATHLIGNSIEQFSLIIALMLFAMGLAGLAQRWVRDPRRVAEVFVLVEILLGVVGGASALGLYLAFAWSSHFRLMLYGLALAVGFAIGMEIPLLMRLNQDWRPDLRENVGDVFSLDYIGALAGALVWAFVLLPLFSLDRISLLLGLTNLAVALGTLVVLWPRVRRRASLVALLIAAVVGLGALTARAPALAGAARQRLFANPVRYHTNSPYQDIVVTGRGSRMSLYLNGHLQFDSEDEFIYHELLVHPALMALGRAPRDVLVLGGGDGLAVREILRWPTVEHVTLVDLDPAVTRLAREYPPLVRLNGGALLDPRVTAPPAAGVTPGPTHRVSKADEHPLGAVAHDSAPIATVRVLHLDADAFLRDPVGPYDAVFADFPDPRAPDLAKLYSLEFYQQVRLRLGPGGVLAVQAGSPYTTRRAFWCVRDTLVAAGFNVLPLHEHVPNFGEWGFLVARRDMAPQPEGAPPVPTRWLTGPVLRAAKVFAPPIGPPRDAPPELSTRLAPRVMTLYLAGEPLTDPELFPGAANR